MVLAVFIGCFILFAIFLYVCFWTDVASDYEKIRDRGHVFGDARWANQHERGALRHDTGILIGQDTETGQPLHAPGTDGHVLVIAGAGAGKGRDVLMPNLMHWPNACFAIDPKGEAAAITGAARARFGRVACINPFQLNDRAPWRLGNTRWNPLDELDPKHPDFITDLRVMARTLVPEAGNGQDPFWDQKARELVYFVLWVVATQPDAENRVITRIPESFAASREKMLDILSRVADDEQDQKIDAGVRIAAGSLRNDLARGNPQYWQSITGTAAQHVTWLTDPRMRNSLAGGDGFTLREAMNSAGDTVFVIPPADKLDELAPWLKLVLHFSVRAKITARNPDRKTLFMIDEAAQLGPIAAIGKGAAAYRGYGIRLMPVFQDLGQIRRIYGEAATVIGNCATQIWFGVRDLETARYLSDSVGSVTAQTISRSAQDGHLPGRDRETEAQAKATLITPDQVMRMPDNRLVARVDGLRPVKAARTPYFLNPAFTGLHRPHPQSTPFAGDDEWPPQPGNDRAIPFHEHV